MKYVELERVDGKAVLLPTREIGAVWEMELTNTQEAKTRICYTNGCSVYVTNDYADVVKKLLRAGVKIFL